MKQVISIHGSDSQHFMQYLDAEHISYDLPSDEFRTWIDDTTVFITIVASVLTITDILRNWLLEKKRSGEPVNLKIEVGDTEVNFTGDIDKALEVLNTLQLDNKQK